MSKLLVLEPLGLVSFERKADSQIVQNIKSVENFGAGWDAPKAGVPGHVDGPRGPPALKVSERPSPRVAFNPPKTLH